jgi:PAS domain S-box-containing protein
VLYLENNLTGRAFAPARIAVLKLIASQAATSLENTRLYRDLSLREAKIRRLVDANIIGIFIWDFEGRILEANDAFLRIVGYDREDITLGRLRWTEVTPPEWGERDAVLTQEQKMTGSLQPFEKEYFRKDGARVPVLIGTAMFEERGDQGVAFVLDLTERKRAEQALRESQEQWKAVFENNPTMYFMVDASGAIVLANPLGAEQLGFTVDELIGLPVQNLFHPEDREAVGRSMAVCFKACGRTISWEARKLRKNGAALWVREMGRVMLIKDRPVALIVCEDITERKRVSDTLREAQAELAHANRVATMGQLTASIAHEVNQPIAANVINAQAALRWLTAERPDLEEVRQALGRIVENANRAGAVIGRIRTLIKKAPPRSDSVAINDAIREVIELTHGETVKNGVSVRTELVDGLPLVEGDRVELQQVIINLVVNAIEAMGATNEPVRELVLGTEEDEPGFVRVAVRDSGPGLEPGASERLFDAFYTTKPSGLGLGLSICRSIIDAHGGRLWATANSPRGAVFQFTVPIHPDIAP